MTAPFISTTDLGEFLGQDITSDPLAIIAIDSACQIIRSHVGRKLNYVKDEQIWMDGNGREALILPENPVPDVGIVSVNDEEVDNTTYHFTENGLLIKITTTPWAVWPLGGWPYGRHNISITYSHGYAIDEVTVATGVERMPADIRSVALRLAKRVFQGGSGQSTSDLSSESIGVYQYSAGSNTSVAAVGEALSDSDKTLLARYRKVTVA